MVKEKAILVGPIVSEMFWEFFRVVPRVVHSKIKEYRDPDIKYIVFTRLDRFDMYGKIADIFVPLNIEGDGTKYISECYRLMNLPYEHYQGLVKSFYDQYSKKYNIIEHIIPDVRDKKNYLNKNYYSSNMMRYQYFPREKNKELVDEYLKNNTKPIVTIAPRYRYKMKRNWPYWQDFYDLLLKSKLINDFNFIICGKIPDYVADSNLKIHDINDIKIDNESSLIGLTMEVLKRSVLTIGSQSAIPNISLILGTEVLEWGDQRKYHTMTYNIFKTKVTYLDDSTFSIKPEVVISKLNEILNKKKGEIRNAE